MDGSRYEGSYSNDVREGFGILTYSSGDRYEGAFRNGVYNGQVNKYI